MAGRVESRFGKLALERRLRLMERCMERCFGRADGVAVVDERGRLVRANPEAPRAFARVGAPDRMESAFPVPDVAAIADGMVPPQSPEWLRRVQIERIKEGGDTLGFLLVVPSPGRCNAPLPDAKPAAGSASVAAFSCIVGDSPVLRAAVQKAQQLAKARVPVLLLGETGVGKELFARGIHQASAVSAGPFVALNCGGLSRDLLASELFGYAEGAFTGARKGGVVGKIEAASHGTLFLDEIGEMPLDIQPHLLRVLEEGELYRLGENTSRKVSFRLIAATNRDLRADIAEGKFRVDLYYRLAVTIISIPPLRERKADLANLIDHWLRASVERYGLARADLDEAARERLLNYDWPGNVRELRNAIEGAVLIARDGIIAVDDLPAEIRAAGCADARGVASSGSHSLPFPRGASLEMAEVEAIRLAIQHCDGNLTQVAIQLGIAKSTLYQKIKKYGLTQDLGATRHIDP
jgi:transcriptional regulator with PAS, ATPase and Fis domain